MATERRPPARKSAAHKRAGGGAAPRKAAAKAVRRGAEKTRPPKPVPSRAPGIESSAEDLAALEVPVDEPALTEAEREARFNRLLHAACLKAGAAAGVSVLTAGVPLLGRLAPVLIGGLLETLTVARVQQQLVRDTLRLYGLDLTDPEEQGVILLATAANMGAQQLSRQTVSLLAARAGSAIGRPIVARLLPVASLVAESGAAIAATYAVGRRAQALCRLSRRDARDLGELLRGLTGIDNRRLAQWSVEALKLALRPFRAVLAGLRG